MPDPELAEHTRQIMLTSERMTVDHDHDLIGAAPTCQTIPMGSSFFLRIRPGLRNGWMSLWGQSCEERISMTVPMVRDALRRRSIINAHEFALAINVCSCKSPKSSCRNEHWRGILGRKSIRNCGV